MAENIKIPMSSPEGVTLITKGKLCDTNIVVTPELEELTVTESGEYTPSKVGYSKVNINIEASEDLDAELTEQEELIAELKDTLMNGVGGGIVSQEDSLSSFLEGSSSIKSNAKKLCDRACYDRDNLIHADFPRVYYIGENAFVACNNLVSLKMPNLSSIYTYAPAFLNQFAYCSKLELIDFGYADFTPGYMLDIKSEILHIILRKRTVIPVTFNPLQNHEPTFFYVPKSLVEDYKSATNWSSCADSIRAIEDYPDICGNYQLNYDYTTESIASDTSLTSSIKTKIGDLVIASIAVRSDLTLSDGWTLISTSIPNSNDANTQTLSWAYKYAQSEEETITVQQTTANRIYINLISLTGATGFIDNGYIYKNDTESLKTVELDRPNEGLILWGVTHSIANSYTWSTDDDAHVVQKMTITEPETNARPRLINFLDNGRDGSGKITIKYGGANSTATFGSLTIKGINIFGVV